MSHYESQVKYSQCKKYLVENVSMNSTIHGTLCVDSLFSSYIV